MGAAVLSVADQAGVELAVAIAQRLDAGEWQLRTTVGLDGDRQPDLSMLRFHILVEADNGLVELCSAKWTALGAPEESARERTPSRAAERLRRTRRPVGIGLAFLTGRRTDLRRWLAASPGVHPLRCRRLPIRGRVPASGDFDHHDLSVGPVGASVVRRHQTKVAGSVAHVQSMARRCVGVGGRGRRRCGSDKHAEGREHENNQSMSHRIPLDIAGRRLSKR